MIYTNIEARYSHNLNYSLKMSVLNASLQDFYYSTVAPPSIKTTPILTISSSFLKNSNIRKETSYTFEYIIKFLYNISAFFTPERSQKA